MSILKLKDSRMVLLKLIVFSTLIICFFTPNKIYCQKSTDLTDNLVNYLGFYVFNTPKNPLYFEKIRGMSINEFPNQNIDNPKTDAKGFTPIDGYVETIDDEKIKFRKATLKKNNDGNYEEFEFETEKLNGISFKFNGNFLNEEVNEDCGSYTKMKGTLLKFKNEKRFASTGTTSFTEFAIL